MKTTTTWRSGHVFESSEENNSITIDGDRKAGLNPKALLLSALAACSAIDLVDILKKMRVPFTDIRVDVEAEQTDGQPRVFRDMHMVFFVKTEFEHEDKVIKAIDLSLEKYCGVAAMLRKNSPIHYRLELM